MTIDRQTLRASWRAWWSQDMERWGPYWLQLLWTLLFSAGLNLVFTVLGFVVNARKLSDWLSLSNWAYWYGRIFVITLTIAVLIHLLFELTATWIGRRRIKSFTRRQRNAYFTIVPLVGVYLGWPLGYALAGWQISDIWSGGNMIVGSLLLSGAVTWLMSVYWSVRQRETEAEVRATEAHLKLLQAQIEPHFLFNTLANVVSLIDHDAPRAKQMLESFVDYLRGSLNQLRHGDTSLGAELDMAQSYLSLIGMRMADRLRWRIEASAEARELRLPPLLLQPLVENAVHHGLEPKLDGGELLVRAEVDAGRL
ncbi:sensor histidine kinase, partial [Piscinibacter sp.]|uniref:sensor histidine kinase n=1 Tax=Piscinibacter sp. TaxID=1903157 RepID=UPI002D098BE2